MNIFEQTARPAHDLFYQRNDPNDVRLGECVLYDIADYDQSRVVLLGLPQDEGIQRNKGRLGAKDAPDEIRKALYKTVEIPNLTFFDLGNTKLANSLEATHNRHQAIVEQVLQDGKTVIVLGGGNDTSFPDCAAVSSVYGKNILAFNIDTHFDVRISATRNSGTPYRQLLEGGWIQPSQFYELANQPFANSPTYQKYLSDLGVTVHPLAEVQQVGIDTLLRDILSKHIVKAIFWGLDMDVVRASDAPGVSAPSPTGLTSHEFCAIAQHAGRDPRTKVFEITELNPTYDIDQRTCRLAAVAIWDFLYHFQNQQ